MHESMISRLRFRVGAVFILKHVLCWLTFWGFAWGTVVLSARVLLDGMPDWLWWGLTTSVPIALAAGWYGWTRVPPRSIFRALVDQAGHCGGLLMAADEVPLGAWQQTLPSAPVLRMHWRGRRSFVPFLLAALFLAVSLWLPQSLASWSPQPLAIGSEVERMSAQIEALKQEAILEQTRAEFLKDKLKQIERDATGKNQTKTLDALDHVQQSLTEAARDAAQKAIRKTENLGKAEGLTDAVRKNGDGLDEQVRKEAMTELAEMVRKSAEETNLLGQHLDPELLKHLESAKLSAEDMKKLAEALKGAKKDLAKMLDRLHKAKLIDADLLKKCDKAGDCDCAGLLKSKGGKMSVKDIVAAGAGKGGTTEGPGSAPITWDRNTSEDGAKFKEETLPAAELARLKESLLLGVGKADPKKGQDPTGSQAGALTGANKGGGSAVTPTILPRHQSTVERFFARPKNKPGSP